MMMGREGSMRTYPEIGVPDPHHPLTHHRGNVEWIERVTKESSVLVEVGFITNPRDEAMMKKPEFRQKMAEAIYKGLAQYASTLSHFQVASRRSATAN